MSAAAPHVALIHDWLTGMRGGEKVLEALAAIYPRAHIYTLVHAPGSVSKAIEALPIHTSWIQRLPMAPRRFRVYLPLFPAAIESFDLRGYDLVVSSSHAVAKGVLPDPAAVHVSYVHTPMRYVWDLAPEYAARMGRLQRLAAPFVASRLRAWDTAASARVDHFVANSAHVARRIGRYYRRDATVVHPPVDTTRFTPGNPDPDRRHLLVVSALVPYKAIELALAAVRGHRLPLVVVGEGPLRARLERQAPPGTRFAGSVGGDQLRDLYRTAAAFLLPGEEDFGIAALEAQACGTPVVAYGRGGALETVIDGVTGTFFVQPTAEALRTAIDRVLSTSHKVDDLRGHALRFSRECFDQQIRRVLDAAMESRNRTAASNPCDARRP